MKIAARDQVVPVPPGTDPDYNDENPLRRLVAIASDNRLAAGRLAYFQQDHLQTLLPIDSLTLYGPREPRQDVLDPRQQDFVDFQKQNLKDFTLGDSRIDRGWVTVDEWTGAFLRVSYRGGPDSKLSQTSGHKLGESIRLHLKVGAAVTPEPLVAPYDEASDRYQIELWAYPGDDLRSRLDADARAAMDRGSVVVRRDLVQGSADAFRREALEGRATPGVSPQHAMHPTLPLRVELAWADHTLQHWDSNGGRNYAYEFSMTVRGWDNYLRVGSSLNPHGGLGTLEYRTLLSNYFEFKATGELGRTPAPWSGDAFGSKDHGGRREPFLAVDYMDLHIVRADAGIGLHRHRDNQEIFMVLENEGIMVVGDWCELPGRDRAFELRYLPAGHFAMLKPGQLHGLMNPTDEDLPLLMFGGYD
jgi:hypothetical protein